MDNEKKKFQIKLYLFKHILRWVMNEDITAFQRKQFI